MRAFLDSPADWITPDAASGAYLEDPPAANGRKVIISDTDHLWGVGGDRDWVWKSFTRGLHPIYMDPLDADPMRERARKAMGHTRRYAAKMALAAMRPSGELTSTRYCLAAEGSEYLVYQPASNRAFTVDLPAGRYRYEWFDPGAGVVVRRGVLTAEAGKQSFEAPFAGDGVLYIRRSAREETR